MGNDATYHWPPAVGWSSAGNKPSNPHLPPPCLKSLVCIKRLGRPKLLFSTRCPIQILRAVVNSMAKTMSAILSFSTSECHWLVVKCVMMFVRQSS